MYMRKKGTGLRRMAAVVLLCVCCVACAAQGWSDEEFTEAATAAGCTYLTEQEKEVFTYMNLARLYPAKFARIEVPQSGDWYVTSLLETLRGMRPVQALCPDEEAYEYARCFAEEQGQSGEKGHTRHKCQRMSGVTWAENCSYGLTTGREIVMLLLIDRGVENLGHRVNILNGALNGAGASIHTHNSSYGYCCVIDYVGRPTAPADYRVPQHRVGGQQQTAPQRQVQKTRPTTSYTPPEQTAPEPERQEPERQEPERQEPERQEPVRQERVPKMRHRFYDRNGTSFVSVISLGYNYSFVDMNHRAELGIVDFRWKLFGMSPLDFEMQVNPVSKWFGYRPSVHAYIPCLTWLAVKPFVGVESDITYLGQFVMKNYVFDYERNYFLSVFGGASVVFLPHRCVPMEVMVGYEHSLINQVKSNGFYLTVRFNFGVGMD